MAHFARLNENNVVVAVHRVSNIDCCDETGHEKEHVGIEFLRKLWGRNTICVQTSYNGKIRKRYAYIGGTYDTGRDAFLPPKPFDSWILDENTCDWIPPIKHPEPNGIDLNDPFKYVWDESKMEWHKTTSDEDVGKYMAQMKPIPDVDPTPGDKSVRDTGKFGDYVAPE